MNEIALSDDQMAVVLSESPAIVVSAGAGSGKTEVIAHRISKVLTDTPDEDFRVVALSYTVKAADELNQRLKSRLGRMHRRVDADTIHGFALGLLRKFGTRIGLPVEPEILNRPEDRVELLQQWLEGEGATPLEDPVAVLNALDIARARCEPTPYLGEWQAALAARGALDYPAVLERACELLEGAWVARNIRRTYRYLVLDEAQNLTPAQYRLLEKLIGEPVDRQVDVVLMGDEQQSIVGFAGADPHLMSKFASDYSAVRINLRTNYRSASRIVELSSAIAKDLGNIRGVSNDVFYSATGAVRSHEVESEYAEGELVADWVNHLLETGLPPEILAEGESPAIAPEDIAVLGRTAASLREPRRSLIRRGIDCATGGTEDDWVESTAAKIVVDLIAYRAAPDHASVRRNIARLAELDGVGSLGPAEDLARAANPELRRLAQLCLASSLVDFIALVESVGIREEGWAADASLLKEAWMSFLDSTDSFDRTFGNFRQHIFRLQRGDSLSPGVRVLTIHKAQGREFKTVVLVGCNEGQIPDFRARSPEARKAELRAFYVATSRASRLLLFTRALQRETRYGSRQTDPSSFLAYLR